jgi:hypothetical protein
MFRNESDIGIGQLLEPGLRVDPQVEDAGLQSPGEHRYRIATELAPVHE